MMDGPQGRMTVVGLGNLLLSDDGYVFNEVYLLVDDPTSQRLVGLLKEDGYQYPCCLPEADRLLVGYSVNKEDMECGIVDLDNLGGPGTA